MPLNSPTDHGGSYATENAINGAIGNDVPTNGGSVPFADAQIFAACGGNAAIAVTGGPEMM